MYDAKLKIITFGDRGSGRRTLVQRLLTNLYVSNIPQNIELDFELTSLSVDGKKVKLEIWNFLEEERKRLRSLGYVQ